MLWASSGLAAIPYYSYYDPIYDSGVVEETLLPKAVSLGDSVFGKSEEGVGGFLSGFKLRANASNTLEYTDNATLSDTSRKSDIADSLGANLAAESDWERHSLRFGLGGNIKRFRDAVSENQNGLNIFTDGRIDITEEWSLNGNLDYSQNSQSRDNPQEDNSNLSRLRDVENTGAGVGIDFRGYPFAISARSTYNHIALEKLDGETQGFRNRDVSRYFAQISYPLTDAVRVFIQPAVSREIYDVSRDASGIKRDSKAYELLGGVAYSVTDITALRIGVGQIRREFEDARLKDAEGLSIDASLQWSPYDDVNLSSSLTRTIESTTLSGVNDLTVTSGRIIPSFAISREMIVSSEFGMDRFEFSNTSISDHDYLAGLGLNYLWSNTVNTGIRYRYRHRISDAVDRDFYSNAIFFTLSCSL